jgi:predicted TIM-barrel fold metal-dependent hydrolase
MVARSYLPKVIVEEARGRLRDKMLFGSDYPFITPDRWLANFEVVATAAGFSPETKVKILYGNAAGILRLV